MNEGGINKKGGPEGGMYERLLHSRRGLQFQRDVGEAESKHEKYSNRIWAVTAKLQLAFIYQIQDITLVQHSQPNKLLEALGPYLIRSICSNH
jgi:hypothetical protein